MTKTCDLLGALSRRLAQGTARLTWDESLSNVSVAVAVLHAAGLLGALVTLGFVMPGRSAMSTFRHHTRSARMARMASG